MATTMNSGSSTRRQVPTRSTQKFPNSPVPLLTSPRIRAIAAQIPTAALANPCTPSPAASQDTGPSLPVLGRHTDQLVDQFFHPPVRGAGVHPGQVVAQRHVQHEQDDDD